MTNRSELPGMPESQPRRPVVVLRALVAVGEDEVSALLWACASSSSACWRETT